MSLRQLVNLRVCRGYLLELEKALVNLRVPIQPFSNREPHLLVLVPQQILFRYLHCDPAANQILNELWKIKDTPDDLVNPLLLCSLRSDQLFDQFVLYKAPNR
jgi:hypothetical protein